MFDIFAFYMTKCVKILPGADLVLAHAEAGEINNGVEHPPIFSQASLFSRICQKNRKRRSAAAGKRAGTARLAQNRGVTHGV